MELFYLIAEIMTMMTKSGRRRTKRVENDTMMEAIRKRRMKSGRRNRRSTIERRRRARSTETGIKWMERTAGLEMNDILEYIILIFKYNFHQSLFFNLNVFLHLINSQINFVTWNILMNMLVPIFLGFGTPIKD